MPTPAQEAFAEGFTALAEIHGNSWVFGASAFAGVELQLEPDDPRLMGGPDRLVLLEVETSLLPVPMPVRGQEISHGSRVFRIDRRDDKPTGRSHFLLVPA